MADDFIGSIAQQDVDFITEIIKTVRIGDNYKHLMVFTDTSQVVASAPFKVYYDDDSNIILSMAEVTADTYAEFAQGTLKIWLEDYFTAGGQESVYIVNVEGDIEAEEPETYTEARLIAAYGKVAQLAYFKSICIDSGTTPGEFKLAPTAATHLATLCANNTLLSAAPLYPYSKEVTSSLDDPAYAAVQSAGKDAFWSYAKPVTLATTKEVHNMSFVALGLALNVINDSSTYVGNSFDMVKTDAIDITSIYGEALPLTVQALLKEGNVQFWKPVGDSSGMIAARGASSMKGRVIPAYWIVAYCNYYNKCQVANYITRRNVMKDATTYNVLLSILSTTASKFVSTGRITNFALTAPAFADLPESKSDEIIVNNAWQALYVDDLRTVKIYGSLTI